MFEFIAGDALPRNIWLVGCGGTGSRILQPLMQLIASRRIPLTTNIFLIDGDTVEAKNCTRQLFLPEEVGDYKANILADRYHELYPNISLIPITGYLSVREVLKPFMDPLVVEEFRNAVETSLGISDVVFHPDTVNNLSKCWYGPLYATYLGVLIQNIRKFLPPESTAEDIQEYMMETLRRLFGGSWKAVALRAFHFIQYVHLSRGIEGYNPPPDWRVAFNMVKLSFPESGLDISTLPEWTREDALSLGLWSNFHKLESIVLGDWSQEEMLAIGATLWFTNNYTEDGGSIRDGIQALHDLTDPGVLRQISSLKMVSPIGAAYASPCSPLDSERKNNIVSRTPRLGRYSLDSMVPLQKAVSGFCSPDIIILAVDSPNARKEILAVATLLTKDTESDRRRKILVVDPGNEDNFGQVSVTTLGKKLPLPIMDSFVPEKEKAKFNCGMSTVHYMPEPCSFIGMDLDMPGQIKEFLEQLPNKGFFTESLDFLPWSPFSFLLRKKSEVAVSCAGMDQTLAINNVMASMTVSALQNAIFQAPATMETSRFSLVSSVMGQSTDIPWFRRKMGEGDVEDTSIAYMGETTETLLLVYRCQGVEHLDVYNKVTMECISTTAETPMFTLVLQAMYEGNNYSTADILNAKIVFVSLVAGVPYPVSIVSTPGSTGRQQCGVVPMRSAHVRITPLAVSEEAFTEECGRDYTPGPATISHVLFLAGILSNPSGYSSKVLAKSLESLEVVSLGYRGIVSGFLENAPELLPEIFTPDPLFQDNGVWEGLSSVSLAIAHARLNTLSLMELVRKKRGLWGGEQPKELNTLSTLELIVKDTVTAAQSSVVVYEMIVAGGTNTRPRSSLWYFGVPTTLKSPYSDTVFINAPKDPQRIWRQKAIRKTMSNIRGFIYQGAATSSPFGPAPDRLPVSNSMYPPRITKLVYLCDNSTVSSRGVLTRSYLLRNTLVSSEFSVRELQRVCGNELTLGYILDDGTWQEFSRGAKLVPTSRDPELALVLSWNVNFLDPLVKITRVAPVEETAAVEVAE
jgi:hypothetical protein